MPNKSKKKEFINKVGIEIHRGSCSNCGESKGVFKKETSYTSTLKYTNYVLDYRKPVKGNIAGIDFEVGQNIYLCLPCIVSSFKKETK